MKFFLILSLFSLSAIASPSLGLESSASLIEKASKKAVSKLSNQRISIDSDSSTDYIIDNVTVKDVYTAELLITVVKNVEGFPEDEFGKCFAVYSAANEYAETVEKIDIKCSVNKGN